MSYLSYSKDFQGVADVFLRVPDLEGRVGSPRPALPARCMSL